MLDKRTLLTKAQEMADCYKETDYLKEMSAISADQDAEQAALKWIGLAVLHGIDAQAEEVSLRCHGDGTVTVLAEYRKKDLPSPGAEVGKKVIEVMRAVTHFEKDKEKGPLPFGLGNDNLELGVKIKRKDGQETVTLKFPG